MKMDVIIFGTGKRYQNNRTMIRQKFNIMAFLDNNKELEGKHVDGVPVFTPNQVSDLQPLPILLVSAKEREMKAQLEGAGISKKRIWDWQKIQCEINQGTYKVFLSDEKAGHRGKILLVSTFLSYNGGTIAIVYAAKELKKRGYDVTLAAPGGDENLIREINGEGIRVLLCLFFPYAYHDKLLWVKQFDMAIVNVYQMIRCACEISRYIPVLWWIHEPSMAYVNIYQDINNRFEEYAIVKQFDNINIMAVSAIAQRNFNMFYPNRIKHVLELGIPDLQGCKVTKSCNKKMVFAIIGDVALHKGQDIILKAVKIINSIRKQQMELWIIGGIGEDDYGEKIRMSVEEYSFVKIKGLLSREEINKKYEEIDVVVCPSLEETFSIVVVEGMMYGKVCVASDATGVARYIDDKVNGLICKAGDAVSLARQMEWVMEHLDELDLIKENARKTYEQYFTMEKFGDRLEEAMEQTLRDYLKP